MTHYCHTTSSGVNLSDHIPHVDSLHGPASSVHRFASRLSDHFPDAPKWGTRTPSLRNHGTTLQPTWEYRRRSSLTFCRSGTSQAKSMTVMNLELDPGMLQRRANHSSAEVDFFSRWAGGSDFNHNDVFRAQTDNRQSYLVGKARAHGALHAWSRANKTRVQACSTYQYGSEHQPGP